MFFQAEEFNGSANPIMAFKGIKIGDYNGKFLKDFHEGRTSK